MGEGRNPPIDGLEISWHHCQDSCLWRGGEGRIWVERMCHGQRLGRQSCRGWASQQERHVNSTGCPHRPLLVPNSSCNSRVDHTAVFSSFRRLRMSQGPETVKTQKTQNGILPSRGLCQQTPLLMLSSVEDFKWGS